MKILAIRGANLASLKDRFEVNFQEEPLDSAGLFAVCGPTGSGKSTLLDALCLALFDSTPRLRRATGRTAKIIDAGDSRLSPSDPRTVLRRGAAEGWAEVDFVGHDGEVWRARWSVRRARGKSSGRLQKSEQTLIRLSDQMQKGRTKSEVQAEITALLGLDFDQFTRAVLLAQNEFGAFLQAGEDERAALLETLTGTDLYSLISQRAHARKQTLEQKLEQLAQRIEAIDVLPEEERQLLEQRLADARKALDQQKRLKATAQQVADWVSQEEKLRASLQQAEAGRAESQRALDAARPRQRLLQRLQAAESVRPDFERWRDLASALVSQQAEQQRQQAELERQEQQLLRLQADHEAAANELRQLCQHKEASAQEVVRARSLDSLIAERSRQLQQLDADLADKRQKLQAQEQSLRALLEARQETEAELAGLQDWLEQHRALAPVVDAWAGIHQQLIEAERRHRQAETAETDLRALQARIPELEIRESKKAQEISQLKDKLSAVSEDSARLSEAVAAEDEEALTEECDRIRIEQSLRQEAGRIHQSWVRNQAEQAGNAAALSGNAQEQQRISAELARLTEALGQLGREAREASVAWERTLVACGDRAEELRARLEADQPCPVCGSHDHPWAEQAPALKGVLEQLKSRRDQSREALQECATGCKLAEEKLANLTRQAGELQAHVARLEQERSRLEDEWRVLAGQISLPELSAGDAAAVLAQRDTELAERLRQLEKRLRALRNLKQQLADLERSRREQGELLRQLELDRSEITRELDKARQQIESLASQCEKDLQQRDQYLARLAEQIPGTSWKDCWLADPAAFVSRLQTEVNEWKGRKLRLDELSHKLTDLRTRIDAEERLCNEARQQLEALAKGHEVQAEALADLRAERSQILGGEDADSFERELTTRLTAAERKVQQLREELYRAGNACERLRGEVENLIRQAERSAAQRAQAEEALQRWIEQFNASAEEDPLDLPGLQGLLEMDPAQRQALAEELEQLKRALNEASTRCEERSAALGAHLDTRPLPSEQMPKSGDEARQRLAEAEKQCEAAEKAVQELLREHDLDQARREDAARLRKQLEAEQRKSRVWIQLAELIGSHDGKKFRNHVQQLTLDLLLRHANQQLAQLAGRYRLQRIPESLALQVIDRDMGDEVRSVHSLSGGESFLVSLALALGLASLSSNRVRVESLFIDEGFGSLDEETLRIAMDALDNLQAQGRKVGVITHVQEMIERITTRVRVERTGAGQSRIVAEG